MVLAASPEWRDHLVAGRRHPRPPSPQHAALAGAVRGRWGRGAVRQADPAPLAAPGARPGNAADPAAVPRALPRVERAPLLSLRPAGSRVVDDGDQRLALRAAAAAVFLAGGLPVALYTDRGGLSLPYAQGRWAGRSQPSHPARPGLGPAGHRAHCSHSPRGAGRSERLNRMLQAGSSTSSPPPRSRPSPRPTRISPSAS
jgi:hypothetical protein